jgi:hypothetical protein
MTELKKKTQLKKIESTRLTCQTNNPVYVTRTT